MYSRHIREDSVMIMTLMSFSSAGKHFSSHVPSKVKIQMPIHGPPGPAGSSLCSALQLLPLPRRHSHLMTISSLTLCFATQCPVVLSAWKVRIPPNVSTLEIPLQKFLHEAHFHLPGFSQNILLVLPACLQVNSITEAVVMCVIYSFAFLSFHGQ